MTEETCANCGHNEEIHGFFGCRGDELSCKCKKFKPQSPKGDENTPVKRPSPVDAKEGDKTLSDKRQVLPLYGGPVYYYLEENVKNFIKELKEELTGDMQPDVVTKWILQTIDKLAGKNLIGKPVNLGK